MEKRVLHSAVVAILVLILFSTAASAATFYVRVDGSDSNTGSANDSGGAWRTIANAAARAAAGDTVRVQAGTYAERVSPSASGTLGAPITFVADGAVTFCGLSLSDGDKYLRFIGFTIDTNAGGCVKVNRAVAVSGTTTGVEFWHNTIRDANQVGIGGGSYADRSHNYLVIGNTFTGFGPGGAAVALRGNHNIIAYNTITASDPDEFVIDGTYSYWLNNYAVKTVTNGAHGDVFQANSTSLGLAYNTFEGNFFIGEGDVSDEHGVLLQDQGGSSCSSGCGAMTENLFRRNVWYSFSGGTFAADSSATTGIFNSRLAHETIVDTMRTSGGATYSSLLRNGNTGYFFNNINDDAWTVGTTVDIRTFFADSGASWTTAGYNSAHKAGATLSFASPWTTQTSPRGNVNPQFADRGNHNFTLQASSESIGAAGALTRTSGSGTGTTLNVATGGGGWFRGRNTNIAQYGGNLIAGDVITVGTDTVTVVSVSGDAITVTPSFTWAHGEPVFWGDDTTPDIGAYPYMPGGYTLSATHAISGSTATVTPNDPSLVRFVVCFSDGVPYAVDNSSPYTCAAPAGTFSANVYPRYASKTLWATVGTTVGTGLTAPKNLKLVGY